MYARVMGVVFCVMIAGGAQAQTRCGWYENPTPGNYWLTDADSTWFIARQGGDEAAGFDSVNWDKTGFVGDSWVRSQGEYGYGCGCIKGEFGDPAGGVVKQITSIRALPLRQCLEDRALPPPPR